MRREVLAGIVVFCVAASLAAAPKKIEAKKSAVSDSSVILDGFEATDWLPANGEGTSIKLSQVEGKDGKALQLDYDLKDTKQWVAISKDIAIPSIDGKAFKFWVKSTGKSNTLEIKLVDADGSNYGVKIPLNGENSWDQVTLDNSDFTYWWGGNSTLDGVKSIQFAISTIDGGAGTVALDDLRLAQSTKKPKGKINSGIFDDCESIVGWTAAADNNSTAKLVSVQTPTGRGIGLDYALGQGNWAQIGKDFSLVLTPKSVFRFQFKWTGDNNMLEFKISDVDGSNFGKKIEFPGKEGEWQDVKIPVSELTYWWGGDKELNDLKAVWLGISRNKGEKGSVAFKNFELIP